MLGLWRELTEYIIIIAMLRFPTLIFKIMQDCWNCELFSLKQWPRWVHIEAQWPAICLHQQSWLMSNYTVFCLSLNLSPRTASECLVISLVSDPAPGTKQFLKIMVNGMTWNLSGCAARTAFIYKSADPEFRQSGLSCMLTEILEVRNIPGEPRMNMKWAGHASQQWNFKCLPRRLNNQNEYYNAIF